MADMVDKVFIKFIKEYQEINGTSIQVYSKPPSPLEFLRESVHPNRPAIIKGAFDHWTARTQWTNDYLRSKMGDTIVTVATTPNGYADAVTQDPISQKEYFVMPYEAHMPFNAFIDIMEEKTMTTNAHYISLQNGSLSVEYSALEQDVDPEIDWCSQALGKSPDAVNFWFGDQKSITSLHKDPYENCYCVIRGKKTFILYPPSEYYCMHESIYPNAVYAPHPTTDQLELKPIESKTPWIPVNPLDPDLTRFPRFCHARPITVTVDEGDMLYLPALWFHQVLQEGDTGVIAINYWYDMDYRNSLFSTVGLYRRWMTGVVEGNHELLEDLEDDSDSV
ncbi:JMJD7-PLA2G4B protein-like protein [Blakeslea trispora]|nr:JMJD7-PLA2G4B protein-like protein [Blakeslea trispora]